MGEMGFVIGKFGLWLERGRAGKTVYMSGVYITLLLPARMYKIPSMYTYAILMLLMTTAIPHLISSNDCEL